MHSEDASNMSAIRADEAGRDAHAQMGFHQGWGAALDQLVALMKR